MKDKLKFPMDFTKCPACGSEKKIIETALNEELIKPTSQKTALHVFAVALIDQLSVLTRVTVPILMILTDACAECGTIYVTRIDKTIGAPQSGPPGSPSFPPSFPPFGGGRG